jgi:hypothetical protein
MAPMMERTRVFPHGVNPGLEHLEHKEVAAIDESCIDHLAFQIGSAFGCRDVEHAMPRRLQRSKAEVAAADDSTDQWWLEFQHRVPRHWHHVGLALVRRDEKNHGSRFEKTIDFGERVRSPGHLHRRN